MSSTAASTAAVPAEAAGPPGARTMTPLLVSSMLNPINTSVVAVALVPIGRAFGAGPDRTVWLVSSLYIVSAAFQPVVGQLVDRFGARRVLLVATTTTFIAAGAALVPVSLDWLIGVRVIIGIGTCAGFPAAMRVLQDGAAHGRVPGGMLAVLSAASQTVAVIGPTLGGLLIAAFGWPAVFAVNIPLAVIVLVTAVLWVPRQPPTAVPRPDLHGVGLFVLAVVTLLLFLTRPAADWRLLLVAVGLVAVLALVLVERRRDLPFLDLPLLRGHPALLRTYARQALAFVVLYGVLFGLTQWLESTRGYSSAVTGLVVLPPPLAAVIASAVPGGTGGLRGRLTLTAALLLAGGVGLGFAGRTSPLVVLLVIAGVFGAAQGLMNVANQKALYLTAPRGQLGQASGFFRTAQFIGATAAGTLIAACYGAHPDTAGLHRLALAVAVAATALLVLTAADRRLSAVGDTTDQHPDPTTDGGDAS